MRSCGAITSDGDKQITLQLVDREYKLQIVKGKGAPTLNDWIKGLELRQKQKSLMDEIDQITLALDDPLNPQQSSTAVADAQLLSQTADQQDAARRKTPPNGENAAVATESKGSDTTTDDADDNVGTPIGQEAAKKSTGKDGKKKENVGGKCCVVS